MIATKTQTAAWALGLATDLAEHDADWSAHIDDSRDLLLAIAKEAQIDLAAPVTRVEAISSWQSVGEVMVNRLLSAAFRLSEGIFSDEDWCQEALRVDNERNRKLPMATGLDEIRAHRLLRRSASVSIGRFEAPAEFHGPSLTVTLVQMDSSKIQVRSA